MGRSGISRSRMSRSFPNIGVAHPTAPTRFSGGSPPSEVFRGTCTPSRLIPLHTWLIVLLKNSQTRCQPDGHYPAHNERWEAAFRKFPVPSKLEEVIVIYRFPTIGGFVTFDSFFSHMANFPKLELADIWVTQGSPFIRIGA